MVQLTLFGSKFVFYTDFALYKYFTLYFPEAIVSEPFSFAAHKIFINKTGVRWP